MAVFDVDLGVDGQQFADPGQVAVQGAAGALRWCVAPQAVDQPLGGHRRVGVDRQQRQDGALPGMSEVDTFAVVPGLDGAQQPDLHGYRPMRGTRALTSEFNISTTFQQR